MKQKALRFVMAIVLIASILAGCSGALVDDHISAPIVASGDLDYYASLGEDNLKALCKGNRIEVTGEVSSGAYTLFYIGDTFSDSVRFSCTFASISDELEAIKAGDIITVQGLCTSVIGDYIYMRDCQLSGSAYTDETDTEATESQTQETETSTMESVFTTTEATTQEAVVTSPSETEAPTETTETIHTHYFCAATCTTPKTCTCGATEGKANGHNWKAATCTNPKKCTVCGTTSGLTAGHTFSGGKCTSCGKADPDYNHETMVWIPTNGGTKYHTHAGCSNMEDPEQVTKSEAESRGFTPCKRCH